MALREYAFETPDFDVYPVEHAIVAAEPAADAVAVRWSDGHESVFHHLWLRDNCPCSECVHPATREQRFEIMSVPEDLAATSIEVAADGALDVTWDGGGHRSRYHPGWLRAHCYSDAGRAGRAGRRASRRTWDAGLGAQLPTFAHEAVMADDSEALAWLASLRDLGIALVRGVPVREHGLVPLIERIAPARWTNFGAIWNVDLSLEKNSNAYTYFELPLHSDLPTREYMPGLQFLHCHANEARGGDSLFADGFRIAEALAREDAEAYGVLTAEAVEFRNTDPEFDYRYRVPMIRLDPSGEVVEVRIGNFLRGPYDTAPERMPLLYRAYRKLVAMTREQRFQLRFRLAPGDMIGFDNRRVLHARTAFDPGTGYRRLQGCYLDRDELLSRIRILERGVRIWAGAT